MKILKLNKKPYFIYCLFLLSILIVSCEKDFVNTISSPQDDSPLQQVISPQQGQNKMLDVPTVEADVNSLKLNKNVKVLDEIANNQMISYSDDKIEFTSHESVNDIQEGDLLSSAPSTLAKYGLLARVLNKEVRKGILILKVEPGEMDDLFEEVDFSYNLQEDPVHKKGTNKAKPDFGINFNIGGNFGAGSVGDKDINIQIAGRVDVSMEYHLNNLGLSDNYFYTRMNMSFDRDRDNPDLRLRLGRSFNWDPIKNRDIVVIVVALGPIGIPFTISMDVGLNFEIHHGVASGLLGFDIHGDAGFEGAARGGINQFSDSWNTVTVDRQVQFENSFDLSASLKAPRVRIKAIPYKKLSNAISSDRDKAALQLYVESYLALSNLMFHNGCLTAEPAIGVKGGFAGNLLGLDYDLGTAAEYPISGLSQIWCGHSDNTYMSNGTFLDNIVQEAEESYTIENSSGLHMAEGLHGKEVVFKSMKGRNSNTEDHSLLYSTLSEDTAGEYLTIESAPDGNYYNSNYRVLGVSNYASDEVVFKLFATDNNRYLIKGANGKFADLHVGSGNPDSHQKFIEFYRTYDEAKSRDDCKFQILMHPHKPGHYYIFKKDKGYLTPKGDNPSRLKIVTRSQEQEFIMMDADEVNTGGLESEIFDVSFKSVSDGDWLVSESYGDGYAYCNRNNIGAWEKFDIIMTPDLTFAIRAQANGKFATVIESDKSRIKFTENDRFNTKCRFRFVDHPSGNGYKAIQFVKTEKYLTCKGSYDSSPLEANRNTMGAWERWIVKIPEL